LWPTFCTSPITTRSGAPLARRAHNLFEMLTLEGAPDCRGLGCLCWSNLLLQSLMLTCAAPPAPFVGAPGGAWTRPATLGTAPTAAPRAVEALILTSRAASWRCGAVVPGQDSIPSRGGEGYGVRTPENRGLNSGCTRVPGAESLDGAPCAVILTEASLHQFLPSGSMGDGR